MSYKKDQLIQLYKSIHNLSLDFDQFLYFENEPENELQRAYAAFLNEAKKAEERAPLFNSPVLNRAKIYFDEITNNLNQKK